MIYIRIFKIIVASTAAIFIVSGVTAFGAGSCAYGYKKCELGGGRFGQCVPNSTQCSFNYNANNRKVSNLLNGFFGVPTVTVSPAGVNSQYFIPRKQIMPNQVMPLYPRPVNSALPCF